MAIQIQFRRGTASEWTSANPTLAVGEMGIETDTNYFKIGDGSTAWNSLAYGGVEGQPGPTGGFNSIQAIASVGTSRALTSDDTGKLITNSGAITITVEGLAVGAQVDFLQTNASQITFLAGSGITLNSRGGALKTAAQYSGASVKCIATNSYVLIGDLAV
jgi:hypothetical protein